MIESEAAMIFFDIDDTLLDFKGAERLAAQAFYQELRGDFDQSSEDFYNAWCTVGAKHFKRFLNGEISFERQKVERVQELFLQAGRSIPETTAGQYFKVYLMHFEDCWSPFPDVLPCLKGLQEFKLGIISNGDSGQQRLKLEKLGISHFFSTIVTAGDAGAAKPDQKIFKAACELAGKPPDKCVYVGDDLAGDILACGEAGMRGVWLNRRNVNPDGYEGMTITGLGELKNLVSFVDAKT